MTTARVAVVTGSSRGIGYGIARGLLFAGFDVVLNGRDGERLDVGRSRLDGDRMANGLKNRLHTKVFDVTDAPSVRTGVEEIEDEIGPIAALVNNAGTVGRSALLDTALHEWEDILRTNATGAFVVGSAAARGMIERGRGKIVNVGSVQSSRARRGLGSYAAAKGALASLTRTMCVEWGPHGIQVNSIAPGYVLTDMNASLRQDDAFSDWLMERTPARRWGVVEDVVGPAVWLCSEQSDFVNGQVIFVDGGVTAAI